MNWDAIGAAGELVGAIAVFVTLLYLARQVRISNLAERQSAQRELMEASRDLIGQLSKDERLANIYLRGSARDPGLTNSEVVQYRSFLMQMVMLWERLYWLKRDGKIDDWLWANNSMNRKEIMSSPGFKSYFNDRKHTFSKEFVDSMEIEVNSLTSSYRPLGIKGAEIRVDDT